MQLNKIPLLLLPLILTACSNTYQDASAEQFYDMIKVEQTWQGTLLTGPVITLEPQVGTTSGVFSADANLFGTESKNPKFQQSTNVKLHVKHTDFGYEYGFVSVNDQAPIAIKQVRSTFRNCTSVCTYDQMFSFSLPDNSLEQDDESAISLKLLETKTSNKGAVLNIPVEYKVGYRAVLKTVGEKINNKSNL